jgi:hypothetical protein
MQVFSGDKPFLDVLHRFSLEAPTFNGMLDRFSKLCYMIKIRRHYFCTEPCTIPVCTRF